MIWQEYQRRRVRKGAEWMHFSWTAELPSQSSRHDVSVSETKRGVHSGQDRQICGCVKTKPGISQAAELLVVCPRLWSRIQRSTLINPASWSWLLDRGPVSKTWYNILWSFYFQWCLNIWWAVASLQLLIPNKSESWIILRVAFSISSTILSQIGEAKNSLIFSSVKKKGHAGVEKNSFRCVSGHGCSAPHHRERGLAEAIPPHSAPLPPHCHCQSVPSPITQPRAASQPVSNLTTKSHCTHKRQGRAGSTESNLICPSPVSLHVANNTHTYTLWVSGKTGQHLSTSIMYISAMCGETRVGNANQKSGFASIIGALSAH